MRPGIMILTMGILALGLGLAVMAGAYLKARAAAFDRLEDGALLVETSYGPAAYRDVGEGRAILVLHGAGGGHDQGLLIAERLLERDARWIIPSRFGYPGSPLPGDASTRAQGLALLELMDRLGLDQVDVLAMSGGVPPALQLASLAPDRVGAMALVSSAPFTPMTADIQDLPIPDWAYQMLFASDLPYWVMSWAARSVLGAVFDAPADVRRGLDAEDRAFLDRLIESFMPVTQRRDGLVNEAAAIDPAAAYALERIRARVVIVHARDDGLNPVAVAERLHARLPGSRLVIHETGGHLLLGARDSVRDALSAHFEPPSR